MASFSSIAAVLFVAASMQLVAAFAPSPSLFVKSSRCQIQSNVMLTPLHMSKDGEEEGGGGIFGGFKNFFVELDKFVDDATARRLGNGSAFYGKRKSSFYGEDDTNKKQVNGFDSTGR
jgi:hypothetical protein